MGKPARWGKGKAKAPSKHRQNPDLEAAFQELASWRFARGLRRVSRSTLSKSKQRPGARKRKELWLKKEAEKEAALAANRLRVPPLPPKGPRTSGAGSSAAEPAEQAAAKKAKKEVAAENPESSEEEMKEEDAEVAPEPSQEAASASAASVKDQQEAEAEEVVSIPSSEDSEAAPVDPLEPWQRRMVAKKMNQFKDEVTATATAHPPDQQLGFHIMVPAIPNRRKPVLEHHWLSRKALLCRAPWGLSADIDGPITLPAELGYVGQGRNRFCYSIPASTDRGKPSVLKLLSPSQSHGMESEAYRRLPLLCARVFWEGEVRTKWANCADRGVAPLRGLVQAKCELALSWLRTRRDSPEAEQFLCYAFITIQYVRLSGIAICDCGESNLGIYAQAQFPMVQFFDTQEWKPEGHAEYLTGFKKLVKAFAPRVYDFVCRGFGGNRVVAASEAIPRCPSYHSNLRVQKILDGNSQFVVPRKERFEE